MYPRAEFREDRREVLLEAIAAIRFAALVVAGPDGLTVAHVPVVAEDGADGLRLGAHVARANPIWRCDGAPAVAILQGPQAYVHPGWYPAKAATGRVVPTWNYVAVQAHGRLAAVHEAAWLRRHLDALTTLNEAAQPAPWAVADAPADYISGRMRGIVGLSLAVGRLEGVWKMSQNHPAPNRQGVRDGLAASAPAVAALMQALEHERD